MELEELFRRDLNLLVALRILLEEGSVRQASVRLNLSQSAMSRILGRLRHLLDDPLFVRQGHHLLPTQRALEINQQLHFPLEQLGALLSPEAFDPRTCSQHFRIATTDYAMQTILPYALPRIYQEAPGISLQFEPLQHEQLLQQLGPDGCDMGICRPTSDLQPLQSQSLGLVGVFCLLSPEHPLAHKTLTLADYLSYPHAMIAISDGVKALIDDCLRDQPPRQIVLRAYHLDAALSILDKLPLIITVPADLAYLVASDHDLVIKPLPFDFKPFDYSLIWHPRCELAAPQQWMRALLLEECSRLIEQRIRDMGLG